MKATKAIIFSHENGGSYVMDHDGCFRFVRGHSAKPIGTEVDVSQQPQVSVMRIVSAAACFVLVAFMSIFTWLWSITDHYIYVDINPSVEMRFNGLGKLKDAAALNSDGTRLLSDLSLRGTADEAVVSLIDAARRKDFLDGSSGGPNVLVTVVAARGGSPDTLIASINTALRERGMLEYTVVEAGSIAYRDKAAGLGVSPGRLQLAEELLRVAGANMTLEEILQMPLGELFAAIANPEGAGGAAAFEGRIAVGDATGPHSPVGTDNNNNDPGGSLTAGNGDGDDTPDDDPAAGDAITINTPDTPLAQAPNQPSGDLPAAEAIINTPPTPGASFTDPPATDPPPTEPPPADEQSADEQPADEPPADPPGANPGGAGPRRTGPRDTTPPGDNGGNGSINEPPGGNDDPPEQPGGDDLTEPPGGDDDPTEPPGGDDDPAEPPPKDPHEDDTHPGDCGCEICAGEGNIGFGAEVYALVTGSGSQRKVAITLIDMFGSYSKVFDYTNGTAEATYNIEGLHYDYRVYVGFSGNAVEIVFITGFETKEGDTFGATVTAAVAGTGANRTVVITVTDEDGEHVKIFAYINGTKIGVYTIEGDKFTYAVYVIYQGNEVHLAMIVDYAKLPENDDDDDGNG